LALQFTACDQTYMGFARQACPEITVIANYSLLHERTWM